MIKLGTMTRTLVGLGIAVVCAEAQTARAQPCSGLGYCGPGENWIDGCGAGTDKLPESKAEIGLYDNADCSGDPITSLVLYGGGTVDRKAEGDPIAGEIQTEITEMNLVGGGVTLIVGAGLGQGQQGYDLKQSFGTIVPTGDPLIALSSFEVFFEIDDGVDYLYNHDPLFIQSEIECIPPKEDYAHPGGQCIELWDAPVGGVKQIWYLGEAVHDADTRNPVPTVSEWGLIFMGLLTLTAGTIMYGRWRRVGTTG